MSNTLVTSFDFTLSGTPEAKAMKKTRFALQKNPWNPMQPETERLAEVQRRNRALYRAHLLEETLAGILDGCQANVAREKLVDWTGWAARSQLDPFKKVGRAIKQHLEMALSLVLFAGRASILCNAGVKSGFS
ncbi:transposase [Sorangium sp. So ce764]|uniref:transposase n=1 Tax=Sorangium sp. So ce764 TaxID=3133320 RepID=UPI003F5F62E0